MLHPPGNHFFRGQCPKIPSAVLGSVPGPRAAAEMLMCLQERSLLLETEDIRASPMGFNISASPRPRIQLRYFMINGLRGCFASLSLLRGFGCH